MEISTKEHPLTYEDFEKLRCSRCKLYLNYPPIMAFLGREDYAECGRCFNEEIAKRDGLHPVRNRSLEVLASVTPFPCKNFVNGCTERRIWPQIDVHEGECLLRSFVCPMSMLRPCKYEGGVQHLEQHFEKKHPGLLLTDGLLTQSFTVNFEENYLVKQNNRLFILQVKNDVIKKQAWFFINLLEEHDLSECSLEFTTLHGSFVVKLTPIFKAVNKIDPSKSLEIDIAALETLLKDSANIKCRVFLCAKFSKLSASQLLKEIQCPVCWDYMKGRIYLCVNGHNICSKCKELVHNCPTCRDNEVLEVRNLSLESVIACALFPCRNHGVGCLYVGAIEEVFYHHKHCAFTKPEDCS